MNRGQEQSGGSFPTKVTIPRHLAVKAEKSFREMAVILSKYDERFSLSRERLFDQIVGLERSAYAMGYRDGRRDRKRRLDQKAPKPTISDLLLRRVPDREGKRK